MNEINQMHQNAGYADAADTMTADQPARFIAAFQEFGHGQPLCSGCRYCAGSCPQGLPAWSMVGYYQLADVFGTQSGLEAVAKRGMDGQPDPNKCAACEACVKRCPRHLPIPDHMKRMAARGRS